MEQTKEIKALFTLIDDPDEEIYSSISEKIVAYGKGIIPNLEHLWETTLSEDVQQRIEGIIQKLHFTDLLEDFTNWKRTVPQDLLSGALLLACTRFFNSACKESLVAGNLGAVYKADIGLF